MALPTTSTQVKDAFDTVWNDFQNLRSYCQQAQSRTAGTAATAASDFLNVANAIVQLRANWAAYQSNTTLWNALVAYAQNILADTTLTATDFANAYNAASSLLNALGTDYPKDANGHLLDRTFPATGMVWVTLTAAQMPNTMSAIAAFIATLS